MINDPMFALYFWLIGIAAAHLGVFALCAPPSQHHSSQEK